MARITYGVIVTEIKGSIGGVTFQKNPSGSIIRSRPTLSKSSTTKQTLSHQKLGVLLFEWQNITQAQRDLWNDFALAWTKVNKFGETKTLTGLNWFTSCNWFRLALNQSLLADPPAHDLPQAPPTFTLDFNDATMEIEFTQAHDFVNSPVLVWASTPTRKNTLSINQVRKLVTIINAAPSNPLDITALWELATGLPYTPTTLFPNANIFLCLESVNLSSGISSAMLCSKDTPSPTDFGTTMYYYS